MDNYIKKVELPNPEAFNSGLTCPTAGFMETVLGWPIPQSQMTAECQQVTNPHILKHLTTKSVGPVKVTGYDLAVKSLALIFDEIKQDNIKLHNLLQLYDEVGTAGMLCCRFIRDTHTPSNHSWGCAIDITIGGVLVPLGEDWTVQGLLDIYPYFHRHKWYSGMGYRHRKDSMHFECSEELILGWKKQNLI